MGFTFMKKLPTPAEIRNEYPIDAEIQALKEKRDQESGMSLPENQINFLQSSVHALLTMKKQLSTIFCVSARYRIRLLTKC